jgi:large subunit ribosomal protein L10
MASKGSAHVPEEKKKLVSELIEKFKNSKTVLIASTNGLPSSQFHSIKKKLRGKAEIMVAKKSIVLRALEKVEKGGIQNLKDLIGADIALFFSDLDAFELSGLLADNESPTKAKPGDISPEDIEIESGPTELMPGPDISALSGVGLKVAVENGKIAIKKGAVIVKSGEEITPEVSSVLGKLGVVPMKVGFEPIGAFDSVSDSVYKDIKIDKKGALEELQTAIGKAFGFAVNLGYVNEKTVGIFIARAGAEGKALSELVKEETSDEGKETSESGDDKDGSGGEGDVNGESKDEEKKEDSESGKPEAPEPEKSVEKSEVKKEETESIKKEENKPQVSEKE